MLELTRPGTAGCLGRCWETYTEIFSVGQDSLLSKSLPTLERSMQAIGVEPDEYYMSVQKVAVANAAGVWARLLKYLQGVWSLLSAHLYGPEVELQMWQDFVDKPLCCLDSWWGQPFQAKLKTMLASRTLKDVLEEVRVPMIHLSRKLLATNMGLESELSQIRRCHGNWRPVFAEKLCHLALLQAAGRAHVDYT